MRMWMLNPTLLCRNHILGEHKECHMIVGCLRKRKNINGYLSRGLIDLRLIQKRHDALVEEMIRRGYKHKTPLPKFKLPTKGTLGYIDIIKNEFDLFGRCKECGKEWREEER